MFKIGCHLSASKGYENMADQSYKIGANTFQFFTRNPRGGNAKEIDEQDIKKFLQKSKEYGIDMPEVRDFNWADSMKDSGD